MSEKTQSVALATVTSPNFLPGTLVMLHSFLRHNSWFRGDLIIIQNDLDSRSKDILQANFERIFFVEPNQELCGRLTGLVTVFPNIKSRQARFHSLQVIGLNGYDRVLFCDSDILFRTSVQELFERADPLICCGDGPHHRGAIRDPVTFAELEKGAAEHGLQFTFNAGFMLMDSSIRTQKNLDALIGMVAVDRWRKVETAHTDQLLLNIYFDGQQRLVDPVYNFMLLHRKDTPETRLEEAKVVHFNGPAKPWNPAAILRHLNRDPTLMAASKLWNAEFSDFLAQDTLMNARWNE